MLDGHPGVSWLTLLLTITRSIKRLSLYPADGPPDSKPVAITGDGNCLYRCMSLLATGDEKLRHVELRRLTMDELFRHAEKYAESIIERARNEAALANRERHPCLSVVTLLSQVLANRPNDVFADSVRKNNPLKDAFVEALKVSATLGRKPATWAGMPEIAALATLLQVNIRTLYPEGTALAYRPFFNSTLSLMDLAKLETKSSPTATIMWSCTGLPTSGHFEKANHFVAVLPTAATKCTKVNPPTTLLHPFVKRTLIKGM